MPELYTKKVPTEECKEVPGVACHLELEMVETPKCYPVPVEECDDILKAEIINIEKHVRQADCTLGVLFVKKTSMKTSSTK